MQATAWAPGNVQVYGCRGYRERHVFRVASTPQYQFQRAFSWNSRPVKVRAISEELVQRVHEENLHMNGTQLFDLPGCKRQESRAGTISVHGGERAGRPRVEDSLTTPIVQTATFTFRSVRLSLCKLALSRLHSSAWSHPLPSNSAGLATDYQTVLCGFLGPCIRRL